MEKQVANFTERHDRPEIAFVEAVSKDKDRVATIPASQLRRQGKVNDPDTKLPCEVEVLDYFVNSKVAEVGENEKSKATRGAGRFLKAVSIPEGTGVDTDQRIDLPAAYVKLRKNGRDLGTYLFWAMAANPEWINIDGTDYQVSLRFERTYKDYKIELVKFH